MLAIVRARLFKKAQFFRLFVNFQIGDMPTPKRLAESLADVRLNIIERHAARTAEITIIGIVCFV